MTVAEVVTEVGSAINGHRRELGRLPADPSAVRVVARHRGRLARFGVGHLQVALAVQGRCVQFPAFGSSGA
jgi:putative resolvase